MGLLDGKQLRDGTLSLDKVAGTGLVTFTSSATMSFQNGAVLRRDTIDILVGTDVANKEYVDAVAAGLNPKASSRLIYNGDITAIAGYTYSNGASGVGATLTFTTFTASDSVLLASGDRIIINSTTDQFVNGIYVYGTTASFFTRATDFDGSPTQEVDGGEFSFVTEGATYGDTGWVVSSPNSTATIGVTPIVWVQFSAAGVINAGDGLYQTGNNFNVGAGTGLTTSANLVSIANTAVSANTYGSADQAVTFTVNAQGQLTAASTQSIAIVSTQVTDFTSASETAIFTDANFVDGITVTFSVTAGDSVTAEVVDGSLGTVKLDTNGAGATAGYILSNDGSGNFVWTSPSTADITGITAGAGLTGGGASGYVTLDVNTDNGLSITNDNVVLGGTLSQNTTINGGGYDYTLGNGGTITTTGSIILSTSEINNNISANGAVQLTANDEVNITQVNSGSGGVNIYAENSFTLSFSYSTVSDSSGNGYGLVYVDDYTGTFVTNSLITKGYVDSQISGVITEVVAANGLTGGGTAGVITLNVNTDNGLSITNDNVVLGGTLSQNTVINGTGVYDLTLGGIDYILMTSSSFDVETDFVSIDSGTGSMQLLGSDITLSADTVDAVGTFSINGTIVAPNLSPLTGQALIYDGTKFAPATMSGDIAGVTAGAGLSGGGSSGFIQLDVELTSNGGLTFSGAGDSGTLQVDYTSVASQLAGNGLIDNGTTIDVNVSNGLTVSGDSVQIDSSAAGAGLAFLSGVFSVNVANGLTVSGDNVEVSPTIAGTGLTFSAGVLSVVAGNAQPEYSQRNLTPSTTAANQNGQPTGITMSYTPNDYSRVSVYVNGQLQYLGDGTTASNTDCYFSADGGTTAKLITSIVATDQLYWNGNSANAGFRLTSTDRVDVIYER